jgi:hypothetical protein
VQQSGDGGVVGRLPDRRSAPIRQCPVAAPLRLASPVDSPTETGAKTSALVGRARIDLGHLGIDVDWQPVPDDHFPGLALLLTGDYTTATVKDFTI